MPRMFTKIEDLGIEKEVINLRKVRKKSYREIAEILSAKYGTEISHMSVKRFFESLAEDVTYTLAKKNKLAKSHLKLIHDVDKELYELYKKMKKYLEELMSTGEPNPQIVRTAEHLLNHLKLMKKLSGELVEAKTQINIIEFAPRVAAFIQKEMKKGRLYCADCGSTNIKYRPEVKIERVED